MRVLEGKNDFPIFWLFVLLVCLFFTAWNYASGAEKASANDNEPIPHSARTVAKVGFLASPDCTDQP